MYGHGAKCCRRHSVCYNCGDNHNTEDKPCDREVKCINCGGNHKAAYKACPSYKFEQALLYIKTNYKFSRRDAMNQLISENRFASNSYARIVTRLPINLRNWSNNQQMFSQNIQQTSHLQELKE